MSAYETCGPAPLLERAAEEEAPARPAPAKEVAERTTTSAPARALARALGRAGVACVVRDDGAGLDVAHGERPTCVVAAGAEQGRVDEALRALGLVRTGDGARRGARRYLGFDETTGVWSCVEVETEPWYGAPTRRLRGPWGRARQAAREAHHLASGDELLDLLLRCLLQDGALAPAARARLRELRAHLLAAPAALRATADTVERGLAPALRWGHISHAIDAEQWDALLARRDAVARRLFWRAPVAHLGQWALDACRRRVALRRRPVGRRGLVVALLGPDGAGKTSLAEALAREPNLQARRIYLGTNPDAGDALALHRWVAERRRAGTRRLGRLTQPALRVLGFLTHLGEQRYRHALALRHRARGGVVVFDRCALDGEVNVALRRARSTWRRRVRDWLLHAGAPRPDVVLVLDAPGAVLYARKGEHSPERLEAMRRAYLGLQARHREVTVVDASRDGEAVRRRVTSLLWARLGARARLEAKP